MALAFPTSPAVGQTHTDGSRAWRWTGARWQSVQALPLAHASTHATGGADAITPASIGAASTLDLAVTNARAIAIAIAL